MENNSKERRQSSRVPIEIPITYKHTNTFFYDYINNISLGGTFIRTSNFLPVGTQFNFIIKLPESDKEFLLKAEVVWIREKDEVTTDVVLPQGMGIKFIFDSGEEQKRFCEEIESLMRKQLGDKLTDKLVKKRGSSPI